MEIVIPKLGMTMTEGTLVEWLVPDGGRVTTDQPLFHLTTDKLDHDEVAPMSGVVRHVVEAGATLDCGTLIGYLLGPDDADVRSAGPGATSSTGLGRWNDRCAYHSGCGSFWRAGGPARAIANGTGSGTGGEGGHRPARRLPRSPCARAGARDRSARHAWERARRADRLGRRSRGTSGAGADLGDSGRPKDRGGARCRAR